MTLSGALWVMGDPHGEAGRLGALLTRAELLGAEGNWEGADAALCCLGDLVDRGPDGLGVIELLMRLEGQAGAAGGRVCVLLGNHEVLLLAARQFGHAWRDARGRSLLERWRLSRGQERDLENLTPQQANWLADRPALARIGPYLFAHADSGAYLQYGRTVGEVNAAVREVLQGKDPTQWDALTRALSERGAYAGEDGPARAAELLAAYGGEKLIHGHTPISYLLKVPPERVRGPLLYAGGKVVNVDGGLAYDPRAGFLARLGEGGVERVLTVAREGSVGRHAR